MTSRRTPVLATWLLTEFGCNPKNESLIGDLSEEYTRGRSRAWYWQQVIMALAVGLSQEVRAHKVIAAQALLTGWSFVLLFGLLQPYLYRVLREVLPASWWTVRWVYVRGWVWPRPVDVLLGIVSCAVAVGIGWTIGRVHRPHHRAMVLLFVGSIFVAFIPAFVFVLARMVHNWQPTAWRYDNPLILLFGASSNILAMVCVLLGGYLSPRLPFRVSTRDERRPESGDA